MINSNQLKHTKRQKWWESSFYFMIFEAPNSKTFNVNACKLIYISSRYAYSNWNTHHVEKHGTQPSLHASCTRIKNHNLKKARRHRTLKEGRDVQTARRPQTRSPLHHSGTLSSPLSLVRTRLLLKCITASAKITFLWKRPCTWRHHTTGRHSRTARNKDRKRSVTRQKKTL